jgi:GNAT superfamily N-acetyltransferase
MPMTIRLATAADVPEIFAIRTSVRENHLSMEQLAELGITLETVPAMLENDGRGWVAEEGGELVAFAMADAAERTVFAMFVRPGYEGRGLGRALMREAEDWLFARECDEIWLLTDAHPAVRANGFYRHLGWHDCGIQEDGQVLFKKWRGQGGDSVGVRRQNCGSTDISSTQPT